MASECIYRSYCEEEEKSGCTLYNRDNGFQSQTVLRSVYCVTVTLKSTSHWPQSPREQSERALELRGEPEGRVQIRPWSHGWFICFGIFSKADIKQSKTFFEGHVNVAAQSTIRVSSLIMRTEHPHKSFQAHLCRGAAEAQCRVENQQTLCFPVPSQSSTTKGPFGIHEDTEVLIVIKAIGQDVYTVHWGSFSTVGKAAICWLVSLNISGLVFSHMVKEGIKEDCNNCSVSFLRFSSWGSALSFSHSQVAFYIHAG